MGRIQWIRSRAIHSFIRLNSITNLVNRFLLGVSPLLAVASFSSASDGPLPHNHYRFNEMFTRGLNAMEKGKPIEASRSLAQLLLEEQTERIWLEYGRALFLSDRTSEADKVFSHILAKYPNLPAPVARNVAVFQAKIRKQKFNISPQFSAGYDDNPYNITDARTVYLFGGLPFRYSVDPEQEKSSAYQEFGLKAEGRLSDNLKWQARTLVKDYPNKPLDRKTNALTLTNHLVSTDNVRLSPSLSIQRIDDHLGSSRWAIQRVFSTQFRPYARLSGAIDGYKLRTFYDDSGRYDSSLTGAGVFFSRQNSVGSHAIRFDHQKNRSLKDSESYDNKRIQLGYKKLFTSWQIGLETGWSYKQFDGDQAPFYVDRNDREWSAGLSGTFSILPTMDHRLTVKVEKIMRTSSINYFSSDQTILSFGFDL